MFISSQKVTQWQMEYRGLEMYEYIVLMFVNCPVMCHDYVTDNFFFTENQHLLPVSSKNAP